MVQDFVSAVAEQAFNGFVRLDNTPVAYDDLCYW
jgi:hypothetical protein